MTQGIYYNPVQGEYFEVETYNCTFLKPLLGVECLNA